MATSWHSTLHLVLLGFTLCAVMPSVYSFSCPSPVSSAWVRYSHIAPRAHNFRVASLRMSDDMTSELRSEAKKAIDPLKEMVENMKVEGLKLELLNLCDETRRGVDSPDGSDSRERIIQLIEELEQQSPTPSSRILSSGDIDGEWVLRWTTSASILGRQRPRGFRVDLNRPITQEIDSKNLKARNVEPVTTFRWVLGGIRYTNSVEAELTALSDSKVAVQFKKFIIADGLVKVTAPDRAKGELDTTFLDTPATAIDGQQIRISRGDRGNLFVLTK